MTNVKTQFKKDHLVPKEWKIKMSNSHKINPRQMPSRKGIIFTDDEKNKLSALAKEKGFGKWMTGKKRSEETKEKIRKYRTGKKLSDKSKQILRERNISNPNKFLRPNTHDTKIERLIESELISKEIIYLKQYPLCGITLCDFFIPEHNIAIYCDGDYWHRLPKAVGRDKGINAFLKKEGYHVFRFWEKDIHRSAFNCVKKIIQFINAR